MSEGRTMPAIVSSLGSKVTRSSCEPRMTRFPFGSTCVTTAGTDRLICSDRLMSPLPCEAEVELKSCFQLPGVGEPPELVVTGWNNQSKPNVPLAVVLRSEE